MTVKMPAKRKARKQADLFSFGRKLQAIIEEQRGLSNRLARLIADIEDEGDHRAIERAKKRDEGKPGIPWAQAKKRLGLD